MEIKSVIKKCGFTQKEVADKLGVTAAALSQSVNNENVSLKMLHRIADVIGCKVGDFFRDEMEDDTPHPELHQWGKFTCPKCGQEILILGIIASPETDKDGDE